MEVALSYLTTNQDLVEDGVVPSTASLPEPSIELLSGTSHSGSLTCFGRVTDIFSDIYVLELDLSSGQRIEVHANVLRYDLPLEVGDQVRVLYVDKDSDDDEDDSDVSIQCR